jgi:Amidohydrolase family
VRLTIIFVILCSLVSTFPVSSDALSEIALTHVTVIDTRDGSTRSDMTVLILGNRISAVGSNTSVRLQKRICVIDGRGKFLIPGLWDMHVHVAGHDRALRLLLASGITGARDMGGEFTKLADSRRRIVSGRVAGPRLLFAGPMLNGPPSEPNSESWVIRSPEQARQAVDSLVTRRVDFIKIHDGLARDTFRAIADAAKAKGIPFVGHVPASMTPVEVSDLGFRYFAPAATSNPALFLGLSDSLGAIEAGKIADLVLLEANPLENISNTKRIMAVNSQGRFLDRKALDGLLASVSENVSGRAIR